MLRAAALTLLAAATILPTPGAAFEMTALRRAELSARLYATGVAEGDPLLVLAAARLRKGLRATPGPLHPRAREAVTEDGPRGWDEMIATALDLAGDDDLIAGLAADIRAEASKGVVSGPIYGNATLSPGGTGQYDAIEFRGGEYAEVYVEARVTTDLRLHVEDAQGRRICSDTDVSHIAYCGWRPATTENYTIRVENAGSVTAPYVLMTN